MKPYLEKLQTDPESSLVTLNRRLDDAIPFQWHHHPEYELTLTLNSGGQRFIGDHVGEYGHGDLVLVGPNLPHTWLSHAKLDPDQPHVALVMWFRPEWMREVTKIFVEFRSIDGLLARARRGLRFSSDFSDELREQIEAVFSLPPADRILSVLKILDRLAADTRAEPLASSAVSQQDIGEGRERIDRVLTYVHQHYAEAVTLQQLADVAALSVSGLHRLFRKHTKTTVSDYLIRLRIGDACGRLSGTEQPISFVADAVGYASIANFNRQFKALKSITPREYRRLFRSAPLVR